MFVQNIEFMTIVLYRTILVIYIVFQNCDISNANLQVAQEERQEYEQISTYDKVQQLQIPKDQIPLVRLPSNTLLKYTAYKDVSILHFRIPSDTRTALFTFKAYEESKSAFQRFCQPRDVTLHLKAGSYPVISPENITFPRHFLDADQRFEIYNLQFQSDGRTQRLAIDGPQSGNWFAVAFISWTDPKDERIEQQGLAASCETLLLSEMSVARVLPIALNSGQVHANTLTNDHNGTREISYKFYVPRNVGIVTARMVIGSLCTTCPDIGFYVQANAMPSRQQNNVHNTIIYPNQTGEITFEFYVQSNLWHYIDIEFIKSESNQDKSQNEVVNDNVGRNNSTATGNKDGSMSNKGKSEGGLDSSKILNDGSSSTNYSNSSSVYNNSTFFEVDFSIQIDFHTEEEPENTEPERPVIFRDIEFYPLLRQTYREFFMFDYDLLPDANGTVPTYLNLTGTMPVGFRFDVGDVYDIGGTLSFALAIRQESRGTIELDIPNAGGALAEKLVDKSLSEDVSNGGTNAEKSNRMNQTIIVCMHLGEPGEPKWPDSCRYGRKILPASCVVNNSNTDSSTGLIHVPFPESGQWYITLGLFCPGPETTARATIIDSVKDFIRKYSELLLYMSNPCSCANASLYYKNCIDNRKCLQQMNETETLKIKECMMDAKCTHNFIEMTRKFEIHHKHATEQNLITENCNSSVVFTISSSPCVAGRCGRYGRCYHYMSGGFVFSTCLCIKGYRGWDCTEDSQVPTSFSILIASLLLTLSNLLFIPSIYFAIRRKYYTESVIYFFAMFFSIFYHACDSGEDEYSFCLVKIGVLQFCDFYCGLLAIWVTLIAMAHIRQQFVSLLHMIGAIILAFGTELNKQSLWVFLAPALTGISLISVSWGMRCRKTRKWFPSRKYLTIFMPIGTVLVMIGLVCYAFLQTKQNYHIVHSIWHMVMALSLLCLLPSRNSFVPKC